ncbi:biliverdin-producing heme oxygenase [Mucilaginibacter sp. RS28]|uniref:Biliverdin-producing heme oxygenase n=1 Tax=Mucilaginibacter straminoryzae TaxID=2932774 RepID=A0A9X1X4K0_9SPHI|nr:biliverdin-producing heme oxygenase [Mucilaginibacter straminoryzae]MCJ8210851.1 biliverdin-producing heme oxygenase [Mucilaginibacter straminoryzae]
MLADVIKEQTTAHHQGLEKKIISRLKSLSSAEDYINLLQLFYSYFGGLEDQINHQIDQSVLPDYEERRKTSSLSNDIQALGGNPASKAVNGALPEITTIPQAVGALYVIEGSTLGGSIISKMVSDRLGLQDGLSFFNSYGSKATEMWERFKTYINTQAWQPAEEQAIIASAQNTFLKFNNWIEQHG